MNFLRKIVWLSFGLYVLLFPGSTLTIPLHMVPDWGIGFGAMLMLLQGSAALGWLLAVGGWRGGAVGLLCLSLAWLIEYIGETSGLPFGRYAYTEVLQPQIAGVVPLPITFAWLMVVTGAWQLANIPGQAARQNGKRRDGQVLVGYLRGLLKSAFKQPRRLKQCALEHGQLLTDGSHGCVSTALLQHASRVPLYPSCTKNSKTGGSRPSSPKSSFQSTKLKIMLFTATLVLLLDLQIETVATLVNPYWIWIDHGPYYGVPTANFVAWWVVGLFMAFVLTKFGGSWKGAKPSYRESGSHADNAAPLRQLLAWVFERIPSLLYILSTLMFILTNAAYGYWMAVAVGIGTLAILGMWLYRL